MGSLSFAEEAAHGFYGAPAFAWRLAESYKIFEGFKAVRARAGQPRNSQLRHRLSFGMPDSSCSSAARRFVRLGFRPAQEETLEL